jgi:hypothetical protein
MDKKLLIEKIKSSATGTTINKDQVLGWVNALPGTSTSLKPTSYKKGDVFMHRIFMHPCVLLKKIEDGSWLCTLLTSEETCSEILEKCDSRFFSENYFTKALFTAVEPIGSFIATFENKSQLKSVLSKLREIVK